MVSKIISGGQTGADRAALDTALELGIPHGGWVPRGRIAEDGRISDEYDLKEMPSEAYDERTEKNVLSSDGTLVLHRGALRGGSQLTLELAVSHGRPCLDVDLQGVNSFEAARRINHWIADQGIRILNVAGPRASQDPEIYSLTCKVLKAAFLMSLVHSGMPDPTDPPVGFGAKPWNMGPPKTVEAAVERLLLELALRDKTMIAHMKAEELASIKESLGGHIRDRYGLGEENGELMASCRKAARSKILDPDEAGMVIIRALWKRLKETHLLRIIK